MRYKCDLSHLMIYTLTRGDIPSLSAWINTKKERRFLFVLFCVGIALFSRAASSQVFSALMSLTSVFGMGTGGPSPPLAPTFLLRFSPSLYKTGCPVLCHFIHFSLIGDPYEIRTRVAGVRGRSLRPLDQRATFCSLRC